MKARRIKRRSEIHYFERIDGSGGQTLRRKRGNIQEYRNKKERYVYRTIWNREDLLGSCYINYEKTPYLKEISEQYAREHYPTCFE
jgi:hypothetical protein